MSGVGQHQSWIAPARLGDAEITAAVADPIQKRGPGKAWFVALLCVLPFVLLTLFAIGAVLTVGIGLSGVNTTVVWGVSIANYVWWIGIGNAGTLISSMLLLTRQHWRASINRFAEAMTLLAAAIAGLFPIIHLGRPLYAYWLAPYPNTMDLWPQWRSALVWDFWAILSYLLFSLLFWFTGLLPDLATLRDRTTTRPGQVIYGALALGWRGSARHWQVYETFHMTMAALAIPLVCSVHSIVGLDFAASLMPGWQESLFPPYFIVGAMYSGFAMVVVLAIAIRWGLNLRAMITRAHFDAMAKVMLFASIVMTFSYATEWFMAWYGGEHADRTVVGYFFTGDYRWLYAGLLFCNCLAPQALWFPAVRVDLRALAALAILINVGMWLERILIVWNTLSRGYAVSLWRTYQISLYDLAILFGPLGLFVLGFLVLARLLPLVSMHEVRQLSHRAGAA
ncbi:hydrogenase [Methylobacterium sp. Leaf469]|uniref:NrfD/PsrC family molybdoenzyme membrane anchor subunit n=1 Tax=Methylobacterium sp. Leaf469 TaxID=1736387 RepID=UPI0006F8E5E8|nr:NrfD/PsrC family molybdoenzyme membrane anchor subunit [Methylobacterium sp. Leaf469]KQU00037.1 hydrogenase [Methylobacterium sp. Leaf469]